MKKCLLVLSFLFTLTAVSHAQKTLSLEFDYARFNYDSSSVFLEFYYDLNPKDMQMLSGDKGASVEAIVHMEMKNVVSNQFFINTCNYNSTQSNYKATLSAYLIILLNEKIKN